MHEQRHATRGPISPPPSFHLYYTSSILQARWTVHFILIWEQRTDVEWTHRLHLLRHQLCIWSMSFRTQRVKCCNPIDVYYRCVLAPILIHGPFQSNGPAFPCFFFSFYFCSVPGNKYVLCGLAIPRMYFFFFFVQHPLWMSDKWCWNNTNTNHIVLALRPPSPHSSHKYVHIHAMCVVHTTNFFIIIIGYSYRSGHWTHCLLTTQSNLHICACEYLRAIPHSFSLFHCRQKKNLLFFFSFSFPLVSFLSPSFLSPLSCPSPPPPHPSWIHFSFHFISFNSIQLRLTNWNSETHFTRHSSIWFLPSPFLFLSFPLSLFYVFPWPCFFVLPTYPPSPTQSRLIPTLTSSRPPFLCLHLHPTKSTHFISYHIS